MGILIGYEKDTKITNTIPLNNLTKHQIIEYIKTNKAKNINLTDASQEMMKMIELDNSDLLTMSIELYQKLFALFGEFNGYIVSDSEKKTMKRQFFIKPKFGVDEIMKSIDISYHIPELPFNDQLLKIHQPIILMVMTDITLDEYNASFNNVLTKKDIIGISKRILRDIPPYLKLRIINVYNQCIDTPQKINSSSVARGSYIYKVAKRGPTTDVASFRQILAIPNIVNQFHRILNIRLSEYMMNNAYLDTNIQKGSIGGQKFPIFKQIFKLKSVLKHANTHNTPCTILFLDISNAFGSLHLDTLYNILRLYNVDPIFISYLAMFYDNLEYYMDTGRDTTEPIKWTNGLIQGCSLSPLLFVIAMNYILVHLNNTYHATCGYEFTNNTKILFTAFIDDIAIIGKDMASTQLVFDEFHKLCATLGLTLNASKSAMISINEDNATTINDIQQVTTFKYLGEYLSSDGTSIASFKQFLGFVIRKLKALDKETDDTKRKTLFDEYLMPYIQKKMMIMYDIGSNNRRKLIFIIKPYIEKWGISVVGNVFYDISSIVNAGDDAVISGIVTDTGYCDEELERDVEISDYVFKNAYLNFTYGDHDEMDDLDALTSE